jgi:Gram-negative bacterial TonB protein C-terminal
VALAIAFMTFASGSTAGAEPHAQHRCTSQARATIATSLAKSAQQRRAHLFLEAMVTAQVAGAALADCAKEGISYEGRTPARTAQLAYEAQAQAVDDGTRVGLSMADPVVVTRLERYAVAAYLGVGATAADRSQARREFFISCSLTNGDDACAGLWSFFTRPRAVPPRTAARDTPPRCTNPDVPPRTVVPAKPTLPASIAGTHSGDVAVVVSLDSASRIIRTRVLQSADPALNESALAAARASRFATEIRNCRPIPGDFLFEVTFGLE